MSWRLAKSLEKLREQLNAAFPQRSKVSDGSVGDLAHRSRASDHNPNSADVVTAIDVTHDPAHGLSGTALSRQLIKDPRTKYVIFDGQIYRTYKPQLGWARYTGPNKHTHHVHISVVADAHEYDDSAPWAFEATPKSFTRSTLRRGDAGPAVRELQVKLSVVVDGQFGDDTMKAVQQLQRKHGLTPDGIVGKRTWEALDLK